ncbi:MAG: hypothetical protein OEX22_06855, partial [Cyclobacteriaceae bacterium]|nr:hypothetical protein [Cyclobacteriaceae bacterium]
SAVLDSTKRADIATKITTLRDNISNANYEVVVRDFEKSNTSPSEIVFQQQSTNLNNLFSQIENDYENRNLTDVVLLSDGIYNSGISPSYRQYNFRVNTIGVGDTLPKKDLLVKELKYNKISYQGNQFPLDAVIETRGFENEAVLVSVYNNGQLIDQKRISPAKSEHIETVKFIVKAESKGLQRYRVSISNKPNEFNTLNNTAQAYVDVIEGKERILMIAASPHPDVKAIRSAIETNSNYEFTLFIPGLHKEPEGKFDLIIYHQFPTKRNTISPWFDKYNDVPYWVFTSLASDYNALNKKIAYAQVALLGKESDYITSSFNAGFTSFSISDDLKNLLSDVPPIEVPFSKVSSNSQVFLYQKLGAVTTRNPLLLLSEIDNRKSALMLADGIWKWRLYEYAKYERHTAFNELVLKMVQFLSTRQDKRKFKFYAVKREVTTSDHVLFETEVYNQLYEPIYDKSIDIAIANEQGIITNYNYITSVGNSRYSVSGLPEGVYTYTATTTLDGKKEKVSGEFMVNQKNKETINLTADFDLLKQLAETSGGKFYTTSTMTALSNDITSNNSPEIIHSEESFQPFINLKWVFVLILLLISTEWFIRKYSGHY